MLLHGGGSSDHSRILDGGPTGSAPWNLRTVTITLGSESALIVEGRDGIHVPGLGPGGGHVGARSAAPGGSAVGEHLRRTGRDQSWCPVLLAACGSGGPPA